MKLKHSKYKNTGLIFECLVRQITTDILNERKSAAQQIIEKFFTKKSELKYELAYYQTLLGKFNKKQLSESVIVDLINTTVKQHNKLSKQKLEKQKYELIKEIKKFYDLNDFFKARIDNYKELASVYQLFEYQNILPKTSSLLKESILQFHLQPNTLKEIQDEFEKQSKEVRLLTYRFLVESFNDKYSDLSKPQQTLLKLYINEQPNSPVLLKTVRQHIGVIGKKINEIGCDDEVLKIKLKEVNDLFEEISKSKLIKEDHLLATLRFHELLRELKKVK